MDRSHSRTNHLVVAALTTLCALLSVSLVVAPTAAAYSVQCHQSGIGCISQYGYTGQSIWNYPVDGAGNNCTNYAAFRLSRNGADNTGSMGHARDWATNARAKGFGVNGTPTVGAIAQWNYGSAYAPSSGHVAYVDEVTGSDIVLSDSNWQGGSKRWRVSPGDRQWPSNFIHIKDVAPSAPTASPRRPDFTGDGKADLLYMDPGSTTMHLLSSTGTSFVGAYSWASGMGQPAWQDAGDFNGDGRSDLVYQDADSTNIRVLTSGGTTISGASVWAAGMGMSAWRVAG